MQGIQTPTMTFTPLAPPPDWDKLARLHGGDIFEMARTFTRDHHDASDIAQEVLVRLGTTSCLPTVWSKSWLWTVVRNVAIDHHRRATRRPWHSLEDQDHPATTSDPSDVTIRVEDAGAVRAAIDRLPDEYRSAILLRFDSDLSYEEMATKLGVPIGTVRSRLSRGRALLRVILEADFAVAS
jgi:RNA polymerase sigma factor (sigma-70 family)